MKFSFIDNFLKWFFIGGSIFYFYHFVTFFSESKPYFESLLSFLIQVVAAFYFVKKSNLNWVNENLFFLLATMTGLMLTKSFFFFYHGLEYQIPTLISILLIYSSFLAFQKYQREN